MSEKNKDKKEITYREFCKTNPISKFKEFYLKKMFKKELVTESIWKKRLKD